MLCYVLLHYYRLSKIPISCSWVYNCYTSTRGHLNPNNLRHENLSSQFFAGKDSNSDAKIDCMRCLQVYVHSTNCECRQHSSVILATFSLHRPLIVFISASFETLVSNLLHRLNYSLFSFHDCRQSYKSES